MSDYATNQALGRTGDTGPSGTCDYNERDQSSAEREVYAHQPPVITARNLDYQRQYRGDDYCGSRVSPCLNAF